MRLLVVVGLVALSVAPASAQPAGQSGIGAVALLPLDADQRLEIYGQPVASEIARALVAGGIDVVVVGPKMVVPERARLIVDGTIKISKGDGVTLAVRVRDPRDGTVIDTLIASAPSLTSIDSAAEELSGRVLPSVRSRLATMDRPERPEVKRVTAPPPSPKPIAPVMLPMVFSVVGAAPLRDELSNAIAPWAQRSHHLATAVEPQTLAPAIAAQTVTASGADLAIALDVLEFVSEAGAIPFATARVRVIVADGKKVVFDRVVVTDTVVGDRGLAAQALAQRVAREVLSILQPNVRRSVAKWE
jgi:hypothetical protein